VLNSVTAAVAALQAAGALKLLSTGSLEPGLTTLDVWSGAVRRIPLPARDADCPACGLRQFPHLEGHGRPPISLCGRNAVQIHERSRPIDLADLKLRLEPIGEVRANEFGLRFFCHPYEMTIFPDGRAIIKGTADAGVARSLYARYVGA
jgi:adenylyltransferase/sulfurtransferase